jgi:NADPH-dependent 2,4-dienoyl-CoA reductase/sulfur reductase-like enzyme
VADRMSAEVVVVGAGPAGIAAAVHAAEAGARVLVLDETPRTGGSIWRGRGAPAKAAARWLERLSRSGAAALSGACVVDTLSPRRLLVDRAGAAVVVEYERLVLATGARELFLPFPGWTRPGVLGAGGAQALLKAGASFAGRSAVVAGTGPLLLAVAAALRKEGAHIVGIAEQAPLARLAAFGAHLAARPSKLKEALDYGARLLGTPYRTGAWVCEAVGSEAVEGVVVTDGRSEREWRCDVLACGFGLVANLELPRLLGCETASGAVEVDAMQRTSLPAVFAAGELTAIGGLSHALVTGTIAGLAAAGRPITARLAREREREAAFAARIARAFAPRGELRRLARPDVVVCRCEDVTLEAVDSAGLGTEAGGGAPGDDASRRAKLHSRAGMGACQGRVCGAALGFLRGAAAFAIRPPLVPAPISVLADGGEATEPTGLSAPHAPAAAAARAQEEKP